MSNIRISRLDKPFLHALKQKYPYNSQIIEIYQRFQGDFKAAAKTLLPKINTEKEWHRLKHQGIGILSINDPEYPALLRHCHNPPLLLYYRGTFKPVNLVPLAFVGSRKMTDYGKHITIHIINGLRDRAVSIISGLALGIDSRAHQSAMENNLYTVAVLGCGLDDRSIYPASNLGLAREILANRGLLLSEFAPGTKGLRHHFPLRNRVIAGMSRATVVAEAAKSSGALITARFALEENRDIFAIPGSIFEPQSEGTNTLISNGATPLLSANDLISYLTNLNSTG